MTNVLDELGIAPRQTVGLASNQRSRLLNFLLRWNHTEEVHTCLDVLVPAIPPSSRCSTCGRRLSWPSTSPMTRWR